MRQILSLLLFLSLAIVGVAQNTPYTSALSPNPFPYRWVRVFEFAGDQVCYDGYGVGITDDNRCVVSFFNNDTITTKKMNLTDGNGRNIPVPVSVYSMNSEGNIVGSLKTMKPPYHSLVSVYKDSILLYDRNDAPKFDTLNLLSSTF